MPKTPPKQERAKKEQAGKSGNPSRNALAKQMSAAAKLSQEQGVKRVLHLEVGSTKTALHRYFTAPEWKALTLNIDPKTPADFCLHPARLSSIPDESFDAVWSNHTLKFFYNTEAPLIFVEFLRVLKKDGLFMMSAHNLKHIASLIASKGLDGTLYEAPSGKVTGLDILYGFRPQVQGENKPFVVPRNGFSASYLAGLFTHSGFRDVALVEEGLLLHASGYKREKHTAENGQVRTRPLDLNKMMQERDKMDVPPTLVQESGKKQKA